MLKNLEINAFADEASSEIDVQIEVLKRHCLDGIELRNADGINVSDLTFEKAAEIKNKFDANGLKIFSLGSPIGKIDVVESFDEHFEKFKHTLEIADILGASNIRVFSFYIPNGAKADDFKNEVIERLGKMCTLAGKSKVDICHENEKGIYGDTAERCLNIFKAIPQLRGVFDPANFVQCSEDVICAWNKLKDYIKYLHIKDSKTDGTIVPPGMGDACITEILKGYIEAGGTCITLEPHLAVFDGLAALEREGEQSVVGNMQYKSNREAFDAGCAALKNILEELKWK